MTFTLAAFYLFGIILLLSGALVVLVRNPVHAALWLVLAFVTAAALWILLFAEFLAITLVLVYVGAVMVLFLFVVMMLDINTDKFRENFWKHFPLAGFIGALIALEMGVLISRGAADSAMPAGTPPSGYSNTKALGQVLYTDYVFPFEIAAVVLLVAIIAAIALTLRSRKETKYQDPGVQLAVKPRDRLKVVKGVQ